MEAKKMNKAQEQSEQYLAEYRIESILNGLLNTVVHSKDPKPIIFMIKYLCSLCTIEDLNQNHIHVDGRMPLRLPVVQYPKFGEDSKSLLKKHLTPQMWKKLRLKITQKGGRIAHCIMSGLNDPLHPIGVHACDSDAYLKFNQLFQPIIYDLHEYEIQTGTKMTHDYNIANIPWDKIQLTSKCITYVQISAQRNIQDYSFLPLLDSYDKLEIERQLGDHFAEFITRRHNILQIDEQTRLKLAQHDLEFHKHPSYEEILANNKWTEGSSILHSEDMSLCVWVNAEDHLKLIMTSVNDPNPSLKNMFSGMFKYLKSLKKPSL